MSINYPWQNILYINALGKTIPYQVDQKSAQDTRDTKPASSAFINLKQQSEAIASVPEAQTDKLLSSSLITINGLDTGVFSVGCHRQAIIENDLFQVSAYIEFAINDQALVSDAGAYFALYFQFHNRLVQSGFQHPVQFEWVIMPAVFTAVGVQGFTCSIKINTTFYPTSQESNRAWAGSLSLVTSHLSNVPRSNGQAIY